MTSADASRRTSPHKRCSSSRPAPGSPGAAHARAVPEILLDALRPTMLSRGGAAMNRAFELLGRWVRSLTHSRLEAVIQLRRAPLHEPAHVASTAAVIRKRRRIARRRLLGSRALAEAHSKGLSEGDRRSTSPARYLPVRWALSLPSPAPGAHRRTPGRAGERKSAGTPSSGRIASTARDLAHVAVPKPCPGQHGGMPVLAGLHVPHPSGPRIPHPGPVPDPPHQPVRHRGTPAWYLAQPQSPLATSSPTGPSRHAAAGSAS